MRIERKRKEEFKTFLALLWLYIPPVVRSFASFFVVCLVITAFLTMVFWLIQGM